MTRNLLAEYARKAPIGTVVRYYPIMRHIPKDKGVQVYYETRIRTRPGFLPNGQVGFGVVGLSMPVSVENLVFEKRK
jgi:hypothetical protein